MNEIRSMPNIKPDENGKIDVSALYDYYDYIDSVIAEKVKAALAEMRAELSRDIAPEPLPEPPTPKSIAPLLATPELDKLWVAGYMPQENNSAPLASSGPAETVLPYAASRAPENADNEKKESRLGFKKKVSFFVIGVIVLAVSVQLLGSSGIIDFQSYADLTSKLFGTVFAG